MQEISSNNKRIAKNTCCLFPDVIYDEATEAS